MDDLNENSNGLTDSAIMSELTAYLDGELENDALVDVEERLAVDEKYRRLMQQLQKSWDVLDILPASSVNRSFTQSTMKLVVDDAKKSASKDRQNNWTWPIRILALLLVPAAASAGAFLASRYFQNIPNQQLQRDLQFVKDLDVINCDENMTVALLEAMSRDKSIFGIIAPPRKDQRKVLFEQQISDIESIRLLTDFEKKRILANNIRFNNLAQKEQKSIKQLYKSIENHTDSQSLKSTLFNYYFWLQEQSSLDAAKVRDLNNIESKLGQIREIVHQQFLPYFTSLLDDQDIKTIGLGLLIVTEQQRDLIDRRFVELYGPIELLNLPADATQFADPKSKTIFSGHKLKRIYDRDPEFIDEIVTHELVQVIKATTLSPAAREILEFASDIANGFRYNQQISEGQLLTSWMLESLDEVFRNDEPDLDSFFETLAADEKERLNNEYPEDRKRELLRLWKERFGQGL